MIEAQPIPASATIVATTEQVSCDVDGEAVILNLKDEVYYGLNKVGARIWKLLEQPRTMAELCGTLFAEYEVEQARVERDVTELLQDMAAHGLVEIKLADTL